MTSDDEGSSPQHVNSSAKSKKSLGAGVGIVATLIGIFASGIAIYDRFKTPDVDIGTFNFELSKLLGEARSNNIELGQTEKINVVFKSIPPEKRYNKFGNLHLNGLSADGQDMSYSDFFSVVLKDSEFSNVNLNNAQSKTHVSLGASEEEAKSLSTLQPLTGMPINANELNSIDTLRIFRMSDSQISNVSFKQSEISGADFSGSVIANSFFEKSRLRFTAFKQSWIAKSSFADLDLTGANFSGATFVNTELRNVDLSAASLHGTRFICSTLQDVSFNESADVTLKSAENILATDTFKQLYNSANIDPLFYGSTLHELPTKGLHFIASDLRGVDLTSLAQDLPLVIQESCVDAQTKLPGHAHITLTRNRDDVCGPNRVDIRICQRADPAFIMKRIFIP